MLDFRSQQKQTEAAYEDQKGSGKLTTQKEQKLFMHVFPETAWA